MIESVAERTRRRVREELDRRKIAQREIAGQLQWSQAKVAQKLNGRTPWTLDELEALCFIAGISPAEAVRDRGMEFCAEMTPTEMRMLDLLRAAGEHDRDAIFQLLGGKVAKGRLEERRASPLHKNTR